MIETPSARPAGRGAFQSHICATVSKHLLRLRHDRPCFSNRNWIGSMLASTAIWSTKLSMAKTLNTWPTARQCLRLDAVRDAAQLDVLVGHAVVGDLHAAGEQQELPPSPTTQCFQPVTLPVASVAASRHWNDCGRNRPWAMSSSRVQISLTGCLHLLARSARIRRPRSRRSSAGRSRRPCSTGVKSTCSSLKPSALATAVARHVGRLAAFPDLDLVAGVAEADHRVQRLHLRVIAEVAAELRLVGSWRRWRTPP